MNCFYHQTVAAVGTCKSCGRGLCAPCAVDIGKGLACRDHCEEDARKVSAMIARAVSRAPVNEHIINNVRRNSILAASFYLLLGVIWLGLSIKRGVTEGWQEPAFFFGIMAAAFIVYGGIVVWRARRIPQPRR